MTKRRLTMVAPMVTPIEMQIVRAPESMPDDFYRSPEWRAIRARIVKRDNYRCTAPDCPTPHRGFGGRIIVDHIVERRKGGSDDDTNLRSLCPTCDARRHPEKGMH